MGKRAFQEAFSGEFDRVERDFYPTPASAVDPLLPFLEYERKSGDFLGWSEPCVGGGAIVDALKSSYPNMVFSCDIEPTGKARPYSDLCNCHEITEDICLECGIDVFITNPPWPAKFLKGEPTTGIIKHLSGLRPSWFLLSADIAHNGYMAHLLQRCTHIVSVGRVKWIPGSKNTGVDNCAWYRFDAKESPTVPRFYGRGIVPPSAV
jgi:hypothetical protein